MTKSKNKKSIRLSNHITPINYDLTLEPDLLAGTFTGQEIIKIKILKETKQITLHAKDLKIETASFRVGKKQILSDKISYNLENETTTFTFKEKLTAGSGLLSIIWTGIINDHLRGFYKSKYILNGIEKHIATTQFEATDARRAIPCFDEPAHKATFDVSLIIPNDQTAISNTLPTSIKEHHAGYNIVSFAQTPIMSTYLLAFIIGDFECLEGVTKNQVKVRVFTTPGKKHQAKFALEVSIKSLEFYNDYFNIPYPLPVLDLIAIPDFESAAMENWGAVTFRETAILVDEENTSLSNKQWAAIVIAHELAHQWFGNLVTMHWWTDLWLNEGFASYMENFCVNHMFPNWQIWDLYLSDRYALALKLDSLSNSHPIEIEVHHPNEINEIFDMVSYAKGSAVIRQLALYLGEDNFKNGLRHYLKKHSYKNTETIDLWQSFEKISGKPVETMMSVWTKQTGYPLVSLSPMPGISKGWKIKQERFFSSRISKSAAKKEKLWSIPIAYESNNEILNLLMTKDSAPLIGAQIGKINKNEVTFMRVCYDETTLKNLKQEILEGRLSTADRLGLIRDLFALAEGGYIQTTVALDFALNYKNENEYIVWAEIATGFNKIYNLISDQTYKVSYQKYVLSLFSPLAKKMTWQHISGEDYAATFLRNLALSQTAHYGDQKIINEAKRVFKNKAKFPIRADIRGVVYGIVAANGNLKDWQTFKKLYEQEEFHEEKDRYARALVSFKDEALLSKTLDLALSGVVRHQDAPFLIAGVWQNNSGRNLTWKFIKKSWPTILKDYAEGGHFLSRLLSPLGNHIKQSDLNDIKKFFAKNKAPGADRALVQSYERIESNIAWLAADKKDIGKWLAKN